MIGEGLISVLLLTLLTLLFNPFHFWMLDEMQMMIVALLIVFFAVFVAFFFKEKVHDEREALHRYIANRFAYLLGVGILVVGIVIQSLAHSLDRWLLVTLGIMIIAKLVGHMYSRAKH